MLIKLKYPLQVQEINEEIHKWLDYLKDENYQEALSLTLHDEYYQWTPELIENIINGYGSEYEDGATKYKVTDWRSASGQLGKTEVVLNEEVVKNGGYTQLGHAIHQMPLNGKWSDLSVVFRLVGYEEGAALLLEEIHVL